MSADTVLSADPGAALVLWAERVEATAEVADMLPGYAVATRDLWRSQAKAIRGVVALHVPEVLFGRAFCGQCGAADGGFPCSTLLELADGFVPGWRDGG